MYSAQLVYNPKQKGLYSAFEVNFVPFAFLFGVGWKDGKWLFQNTRKKDQVGVKREAAIPTQGTVTFFSKIK